MTNRMGNYQDQDGNWFTAMGLPLRIINLEYLGATLEHPERAIRVFYNDRMIILAVMSGIAGLMEQNEMAPYQDTLGNLLANEREYWFANKNPYITTKLFL